MTAPERMWAPTSEPFSTMTTDFSGASCLSRIAAASPAGPAPTITVSNSIASRGGSCDVFTSCACCTRLLLNPRQQGPIVHESGALTIATPEDDSVLQA